MPRIRLFALALLIVFAGCEGDNLVQLRASGTFEPNVVAFGEVGVDLAETQIVIFKNTSQAPFIVESVDDTPNFIVKGLEVDTVVPGGAELEIEATYLAVGEATHEETLVVHDGDVAVSLTLSASGVLRMVPQLSIVPEAGLDFGVVEVGLTGRLPFAVDNTGNASATIMSATYESGSTAYSVSLPGPIIVAEGIRGVFTVTFAPTAEGIIEERLILNIAELPEPVVIPLKGEGGDPTGAIFCTPAAAVFSELPRGQTMSLDLNCTAKGADVTINSIALVDENVPFAVTAPTGVPGALPQNASITIPVAFNPDGLPGDVAGSLSIAYANDRGAAEVVVPITGRVGPPPPDDQAISVTLRWDKNNTDVDIHLLQPDGLLFDRELATDCHYANKDPDWGTPNDTTDNPFLDVDDVDGFGPETINMARAPDGKYKLKAHYFKARGNGPVNVTVDVFIGGQMVATVMSEPLENGDVWDVGTIEYTNGTGVFTEGGDGCTCTKIRRSPSHLALVVLVFGAGLLLRRRQR